MVYPMIYNYRVSTKVVHDFFHPQYVHMEFFFWNRATPSFHPFSWDFYGIFHHKRHKPSSYWGTIGSPQGLRSGRRVVQASLIHRDQLRGLAALLLSPVLAEPEKPQPYEVMSRIMRLVAWRLGENHGKTMGQLWTTVGWLCWFLFPKSWFRNHLEMVDSHGFSTFKC